MSERQIGEMNIVPCPLCPDELELITPQSHLAEHLESISLLVLSAVVEEDEDIKSEDAAGGETSSRMLESDDFEEGLNFPENANPSSYSILLTLKFQFTHHIPTREERDGSRRLI
jgi:hypothetical protein